MSLMDLFLECFGKDSYNKAHGLQRPQSSLGLDLLNPEVDADRRSMTQIEVDIVAVHGLNGHRRDTWTDARTKYFWLKELSQTQNLGNTARVFTFGYDATLVFNSSKALLGDIANNLLDELQGKRMDGELEMRRPIIFICHSLGGIVVKKAFLNAYNNTAQYGTLKESIYGIVFMGTPHQGSTVANLATNIARVANIAGTSFFSRKNLLSSLVKSLERDSETLQDIAENFRHHANGEYRKLVKIVSFFEMKETPPLGKRVVDKSSAVLGLTGEIETQIGLNADHRAMCRYSSAEDENFKTVSRHIRIMAEGAAIRSENTAELPKEFLELSKRLHKVDYEAHLEEALAKRCENTAKWIFENQTYRSWETSPRHQSLWLTGEVGSGKTVTVASVIDQLQRNCSAPTAPGNRPMIVYFFCDSKEAAKSDPSNVLTAFLHQLLNQKASFGYEIAKSTKGAGRSFSFTLEKATKILRQILDKIPKVFLILDAIDECSGGEAQLLENLFGLTKYTNCLKLLVTSRPHPGPALDQVFRKRRGSIIPISLVEDRVRIDIERLISGKMQEFKSIENIREDLRQRLKVTILDQAGGMFLWAALAWEMFSNSWDYEWNVEGVEKRLETLVALGRSSITPRNYQRSLGVRGERTLYGYYTAILELIPAARRDNTKRLFSWLVTAHAPLTIAELRTAYALKDCHTCSDSLEDHLYAGDFSDEVKSRCSPFIKIVGANQTVKLVHQSVKEFFLETEHDEHFAFKLNFADAELKNSIACLTYLSFKDFSNIPSYQNQIHEDEEDLQRLEKYPFLRYSALHWSYHTKNVQEQPLVWKTFLAWAGLRINMNFSFRIFWYSEGKGPLPRNATPMHILCYFGLDKLVERALLARKASIARDKSTWGKPPLTWATVCDRDGVGRTPLHWAAANGHGEVVRILLRNDADPQAEAYEGGISACTPMHLAVDFGHMNVVQLLLDRAGDCGQRLEWLELASAGGHVELVKKIFSFGVDVNIQVGDYGSALHAAAYEDHIGVVRWLLQNGADVNLNYGQHGTPLQAAAFEGNLDIVRLLLDKGADVNAGGGLHGSPLQAAAYRDWKEIAQELLDRGADANVSGGQHGSPFGAAMFSGHQGMMALLKGYGSLPTEPAFLRRASELDKATVYAIGLIEKEVKKGRLPGVEKRAEKVVEEFRKAIANGNKRTLKVLFEIGFGAFKAAVRAGREGFLHFVVEKGMVILQMAAQKGYQEGVEILSKSYTKALTFVLDEGKPVLVEKLLFECVKGLKVLIEDERDDDVRDLEVAAIEIFFAVVDSKHDKLIKIMAKVWVEAFEEFMSPKFRKDLMKLIRTFAAKWIAEIRQRKAEKVTLWAKASAEALFAAVVGKQKGVVETLSYIFTQILQQVFAEESKDAVFWLLDIGKRELSQVDVSGMDQIQAEKTVLLAAEFLLATELGGRLEEGRDCQTAQMKLLDLSVPVFQTLEDASLLETVEQALRTFSSEKLDDCSDRKQLQILEGDISRVLDAIIRVDGGTGLEGALSRVKKAVRSHADSITTARWT